MSGVVVMVCGKLKINPFAPIGKLDNDLCSKFSKYVHFSPSFRAEGGFFSCLKSALFKYHTLHL